MTKSKNTLNIGDNGIDGVSIKPMGDSAVLVEFESDCERAAAFAKHLINNRVKSVVDVVPALHSVGVHYAPEFWLDGPVNQTPYERFVTVLRIVLRNVRPLDDAKTSYVKVPVVYGGEYGEDLAELAQQRNLSKKELIRLHSERVYTVHMLGFAPGFCYMGPVDARIDTPRRASPRTRVKKGTVAVANGMTGIYPANLPGGWYLLGRTPLVMFDVERSPTCLVSVGDQVKFFEVSEEEFLRIEEAQV